MINRNVWWSKVWLLSLIVALAFGASLYAQDRDDEGRWVFLEAGMSTVTAITM